MKKIGILLLSFCFISQINAQNVYDDALTAASYAYSHTKKAHGANNIFHTQEYADKAIESFQKAEDLADQCNCTVANETAYQARVDLESALEQDTFERSRYYAKRAKDLGTQLLEQLTLCQDNSSQSYSSTEAIDEEENALADASEEVSNKQKELDEKRRQLEIEQKKLEQQIAAQNKMKAKFEAQRAAELTEQALIKSKAEQALQKLETALQELNTVFNGQSTLVSLKEEYTRNENELKNETLDDTKSFYIDRAKELTKTAMKQFAGYIEEDQ